MHLVHPVCSKNVKIPLFLFFFSPVSRTLLENNAWVLTTGGLGQVPMCMDLLVESSPRENI